MRLHRLTVICFLIALAMYAIGNGALSVTDPVESNYALTAKEMAVTGDWLSPQIYHNYWYDKPIMIYWLIGLSYKLFGFTDFAARFPAALFGALAIGLFYQVVRSISGRRLLSLWSAMILGSSLEFWLLARGIVTDMVLLWATIGTFAYAYRGLTEGKTRFMVWAYIFAGLGVLTKGPVALVLPGILLLVYALVMRSWSMVRYIFAWQGILAFIIVVLPWYGYMYLTHGQDFINGFLGLHNVVRATQSEHPDVNYWWYYLAMFPIASLPWTGAILYGMYYGWRLKQPFYIFSMVMGWGTLLFYSLMATKYPTYTFISLIPFSFLGAFGVVKLLRPGAPCKGWWRLMGPAFALWLILGIASFFVPWGFWYLLYVFIVVGIIVTVLMYINRKRYMLPVVIAFVTMAIAGLVIHEGVQPLIEQRSSETYAPIVANYEGNIYFYGNYSASLVYYTDKEITKIEDDAIPSIREKRSAAWDGKNTMPTKTVAEVVKQFEVTQYNEERILRSVTNNQGRPTRLPMGDKPTAPMPIDNPVPLQAMIIVPEKLQPYFEATPLFKMVELKRSINKVLIYETP
ncbi:glycosyltransferase family 39 protein [Veillonella sp. R32]|uniref:ArnT family glycosyltransferase n=1 Tax=Veillonella sp. R32 TaxID=2021312 RepID=UPI00138A00A2|nr:glycosyltransferase family 39 protein [Veillonella sp. R32]KAF1682551.1 dolichyl-phosphate-mannose--protein mannosyltransferase [Veillonella sp. R32]